MTIDASLTPRRSFAPGDRVYAIGAPSILVPGLRHRPSGWITLDRKIGSVADGDRSLWRAFDDRGDVHYPRESELRRPGLRLAYSAPAGDRRLLNGLDARLTQHPAILAAHGGPMSGSWLDRIDHGMPWPPGPPSAGGDPA